MGTLTLRSLHLTLYEFLNEYSDFNTISDALVWNSPVIHSIFPIGWQVYQVLRTKVLLVTYAAINVMPEGGGSRDKVGTLNVIVHPRWGILANFEHKCWPRDQQVWTMLNWMQGAWIWMFCHLESTQNSQRFEFSSCNKMEEWKELIFNTPFFCVRRSGTQT